MQNEQRDLRHCWNSAPEIPPSPIKVSRDIPKSNNLWRFPVDSCACMSLGGGFNDVNHYSLERCITRQRIAQAVEILLEIHRFAPELGHVVVLLLAVEQSEPSRHQPPVEFE